MKIYIIKCCTWEEKTKAFELQKTKEWYNLYAVKSEDEAKKDVNKLTINAIKEHKDFNWSMAYEYEEKELY